MMKLKIKCGNQELQDRYVNHSSYHEGDSGIDLFTPEIHEIPPKAISYKIDLNIQCEGLVNDKNISYYLYPRSSTGSKTPLRLSNSVGIIDSGYRGNLIAIVDNMDDKPVMIEKNSRLFQICSPTLSPISIEVVNSLTSSERSNQGLGSTGN